MKSYTVPLICIEFESIEFDSIEYNFNSILKNILSLCIISEVRVNFSVSSFIKQNSIHSRVWLSIMYIEQHHMYYISSMSDCVCQAVMKFYQA
jgi:hypothetical protein